MDWLWITLGSITALAGLALALWALFHDRPRGRLRCPRCWYDMAGAVARTCPECGATAASDRALGRTRRRWLWATAGLIIIASGAAATRAPAMRRHGWTTAVPNPVWRLVLPIIDPVPEAARGDWLAEPDQHWERSWHRLLLAHRCAVLADLIAADPAMMDAPAERHQLPLSEALAAALADLPLLGEHRLLAHGPLRRLLDSLPPAHPTRSICVWTLHFSEPSEASIPLLARLLRGDTSAGVRIAAITALDSYAGNDPRGPGSTELLDAFVAALEDEDEIVRLNAARSLRDWAPAQPRIIAALERHAAEDDDDTVRARASEALERLRSEVADGG